MCTGALGDSLTRIIVLFAEQILKNYTKIRFAPLIISENTRDILRCLTLMELCGRPASRTAPCWVLSEEMQPFINHLDLNMQVCQTRYSLVSSNVPPTCPGAATMPAGPVDH